MKTIKQLIIKGTLSILGFDENISNQIPVLVCYFSECRRLFNLYWFAFITRPAINIRLHIDRLYDSFLSYRPALPLQDSLFDGDLRLTLPKTMLIAVALVFLQLSSAKAQTLDEYITVGMQNNEVVHQKNFALEKSYQALKEAKGAFYPTVSLLADYNLASGGRTIDLPLGDLFNPVYSSLNKLTASSQFPTIANQQIQLAPNNFSDTRLYTTLQLVNAEIRYNAKLKKEAITQQQAEVNVYKRGLVRSIKEAYFNLQLALRQKTVLTNAATLLNQNLRYTKSLVENGKVLKGSALRIQSDINSNQAKLTAVENDYTVARAYFNFLLNRPSTEEVNVDTTIAVQNIEAVQAAGIEDVLSRREERQSLKSGIKQAEYTVKIRKAFYIPTVSTFASTGFQGTGYHFGSSEHYTFGGISLKWNLFNGFQSSSRIKQAALDVAVLNSQYENLEKQLNVQLITAQAAVRTAQKELESAKANQEQAREYYRETRNRYSQGLVLLVELTDSYTQFINNQQSYQIAVINLMKKNADLEQVTATYPL